MRSAPALALAALLASCSDDKAPSTTPRDQQADLGGEAVARVSAGGANDVVPKGLVAKVAAEQKVTPNEAAHRLVDDAVAAVAARDRGLDRVSPTRWRLISARARMTIDRVRADARANGPPTDEEVKELSIRHWREVDRPESARVVHAVALRSKPPNPAFDARAKTVASEIRKAVEGASSPEDFVEKAKAVPHDKDVQVIAEPLPALTDDGFSTEGPGSFDLDFVRGAFALKKPGELSAIVESAFGFHIIRLVERVPEQRMPFEARRIAFTEEAYSLRTQKALAALLTPLRAAHPVTVEPSAEQLMRSVMTSEEK